MTNNQINLAVVAFTIPVFCASFWYGLQYQTSVESAQHDSVLVAECIRRNTEQRSAYLARSYPRRGTYQALLIPSSDDITHYTVGCQTNPSFVAGTR